MGKGKCLLTSDFVSVYLPLCSFSQLCVLVRTNRVFGHREVWSFHVFLFLLVLVLVVCC